MKEELNSNKENDVTEDQGNELHTNLPSSSKPSGKDTQAPNHNVSPYSIIAKAIPLAFGIALFAILLTVVIYLLLK